MRYISTRGEAREVSFFEALLAGLAADGGLFVPEPWPHFTPDQIAAFAGRPYDEVAAAVMGAFIGGEMPAERLLSICTEAYATFSHPAVAPLRQLAPDTFLLELFHGPTLAFKDFALQVVARLFDHALGETGQRLTILCATSGDTGGAAVSAFSGRRNITIVALYPDGRISEVQRRFMTTASESNVAAAAIAGDFDDCQGLVKTLLADRRLVRDIGLSAVNSINFARIAAQTVYYFAAAAALGAPHRTPIFAVPTGNFGDAFAAYGAHRMGLGMERIIVATNGNDIVARGLESGRYRRGPALATLSPAMDIQVASNFERLYFEYSGRDAAETAAAFRDFAASGAMEVPGVVQMGSRGLFRGVSVNETATTAAISAAWSAAGVLIDPHTAVALAAASQAGLDTDTHPLVALATAHPAKFPDAVRGGHRRHAAGSQERPRHS